MNSKLSVKLKQISVLVLFTLTIAACKKTGVTPGNGNTSKQTGKDIQSVSILKSENGNLTGDGYYYKSGLKIFISIPLGSNISSVKTNFYLSDKATIKIDGNTLSGNSGTLDLSKTISATVTAEDGSFTTYTILAQTGIKDIDQVIFPLMEKYSIPGCSYAIAKNSIENVVYKNACGFAVQETKERATADHMFRLASMTKQHTAIAIMTLIQQGKIGIDDLVFGPTGILKSLYPSVGSKSAKVTVRHLLEHTGGYTGDPMFTSAYAGKTLEERIQIMLDSAQDEPGTKYYYYNMGYGTLGKIIEVVTGKDYLTYLREIYAPAGVTNIYMAATSAATRRQNEAVCYGQSGSDAYGNDINVYKAAGGVLINTTDLFKILYAVDGGTIRPDILNAATRTLMFTKSDVSGNNYAKGWRTNHSLFKGYYHGGNLAGTATFWIYGEDYSVAILMNSRSPIDTFDVDLIVAASDILSKAKALAL